MARRVLLVQPSLQPPGGGNGVAAWMLQALVPDHHVTVLSWKPIEVEPINRFFGTALRTSDFDSLTLPRGWYAIDRAPVPAALFRSSLMMRHVREIGDRFDVLISAHNEVDYGRRAIQYIHYPTYLRPRPSVDLRWYHRWPAVLNAYYRTADRFAGFSVDRMKRNVTLANSNWTASQIRRFLGIDAMTVYPPVVGTNQTIAWDARRPRFVAVGRMSPEKEYERIIRILTLVRRRISDVTLTIVGTWDRHVRRYREEIRDAAAVAGAWIEFRHNLSRDQIRELLAESRYGIHGMREEHFGMAPAEMAAAGMIVWVPDGGGQVEIVGNEPALVYDTEEQAAESIARVIDDAAEQERLRDNLAGRTKLFDTERFVAQIRSVVETFRE